VSKIATQRGRQVVWVSYSLQIKPYSYDVEKRFVRSDNGGRTWHADPHYQDRRSLNSEKAPVVYRYRPDELLMRSVDGGAHWVDCAFIVDGLSPQQFVAKVVNKESQAKLSFSLSAIQPGSPSTIYGVLVIGPDPETLKTIGLPGVYVSHDAGDHWSMFAPDLRGWDPDESNSVLGINPSNPKQMLGHAKSGLVISADGGVTWRPVGQQSELEKPAEIKGRKDAIAQRPDASSIPIYPTWAYLKVYQIEFQRGSGAIYLLTNKGLYRSEDSAQTWCLVYSGTPSVSELTSLVFDPDNPKRLFVNTRTNILISDDGACHFRVLLDATRFARSKQDRTSTSQSR